MFINTAIFTQVILSAKLSHTLPMGNGALNEFAMHNLSNFSSIFSTYTPTSYSFEHGQELYVEINNVIEAINANASEIKGDCIFESLGFKIIPLSDLAMKERKRLLSLLYFYFDQMRSIMPPATYDAYEREFRASNLDKCLSIIQSVYGARNVAECAFMKAHAQRETLEKTKHDGLLFVDLNTAKTFFLDFKRKTNGKNKVLIVPNGFLNLFTFYTYSLHLIDKMIETSNYEYQINTVKEHLFGGRSIQVTENTTWHSEVAGAPIAKILAFKHYVYCMFSLEVLGLPARDVKEIGDELKNKMFQQVGGCKVYMIKEELNLAKFLGNVCFSTK